LSSESPAILSMESNSEGPETTGNDAIF